jgi:hypothetical protein
VRIPDEYLAQFTALETAAILSAYSVNGFALKYSLPDACWWAVPLPSANAAKQQPN